MSATVVAKGLSGGYSHRVLFEGLDLTIAPGDVVGANGAGKSTLLSLLDGAVAPHDGVGRARPRGRVRGAGALGASRPQLGGVAPRFAENCYLSWPPPYTRQVGSMNELRARYSVGEYDGAFIVAPSRSLLEEVS